MIVKRKIQKVTSFYGVRKGFLRKHKGIDLRSYNDNFTKKLPIVLPEDCILLRKVFQGKWGWTYVFQPLQTDYDEIKFIHMEENENLILDFEYVKGFDIGFTGTTNYMIKKGYGEHLHFETWFNNKAIDPIKYLDLLEIKWK